MKSWENLTWKSSDCSPRLSDVATVPWKFQVIFNSNIHTYFWLLTLSHKKTLCNPLAHPTWKCHHTNLWIAKLFHLTEGLLRSFRRLRLWKEPVVGCRRWLWKEPVVMCGKWNVRQAMSQQLFRVITFSIYTCFQSFWHCQSHSTPRCAEIQSMSQQAAVPSLNMSMSLHALLL